MKKAEGMMKRMDRGNGFTLIELLIVVAIIGILAAIAVPNFLNAQMRAKISRTYADQKAITTVLEMYFLDWNSYVEDHDWPTDPSQRGFFRLTTPLAYIASLPLDPFPARHLQTQERNPTFEFGSGHATKPGVQWPAQAYLIMSPGPNLIEENSANDDFPFGTVIRTYDITNGLTSNGDIILMGGNYRSGRIMVDGKWIVR